MNQLGGVLLNFAFDVRYKRQKTRLLVKALSFFVAASRGMVMKKQSYRALMAAKGRWVARWGFSLWSCFVLPLPTIRYFVVLGWLLKLWLLEEVALV